MTRNWKVFILAAVVAVIAGGAGKYIGLAALAVLAPIYGLLVASIFLMAFIVVAGVSVSIGRVVLNRRETLALRPAVTIEHKDENRPRAA